MKKMLFAAVVCAVAAATAFSQAAEVLESGPALLVMAAEPCDVLVDGEPRGRSPLLLWNLPAGEITLEARSGDRSVTIRVRITAGLAGIAAWEPVLPAAPASFAMPDAVALPEFLASSGPSLSVGFSGMVPGAVVTLNGEPIDAAAAAIPAGDYLVMATAPGFLPFMDLVRVSDGTSTIPLALAKDPSVGDKAMKTVGWSATAAGAAAAAAGFVLNLNAVAVPLSGESFDAYRTIKYAALGTLGAGAILAVVGIVLAVVN